MQSPQANKNSVTVLIGEQRGSRRDAPGSRAESARLFFLTLMERDGVWTQGTPTPASNGAGIAPAWFNVPVGSHR